MSQKTLEKVLEHLLNHEQDAAGELLHSYFVEKGRSIYESMIQSDEQVEEEIGGDPISDFEEEVIADEAEIEDEEMFSEDEDEDADPVTDDAAAAEVAPDVAPDVAPVDVAPTDDTGDHVEDAMMDVEDAISALKAEFDKLVNGEEEAPVPAPAPEPEEVEAVEEEIVSDPVSDLEEEVITDDATRG